MIENFKNIDEVKKILLHNDANLIVLLIARYSDGENLYGNIDEASLNDLCGEKVIFGMPNRIKKGKIKESDKKHYSKTLISDIINELKIDENKVPCLYLYDINNKLGRTVSINNSTNIYELIKKIVVNCERYLIEIKKQKIYANGIDVMVNSLEEKNNFINTFLTKQDVAIKTITLITALYTFVNIILNMQYRIACENYYNIPSKYFNTDYSSKIILLICLIFLITTPIMCFCGKRYLIKSGATKLEVIIFTTLFTIYISICIGLLNLFSLRYIIEKEINIPINIANFINKYANEIVWGVMILGILSVFGIVLFDNIGKIKNKIIKKVMQFISWTPIALTVTLFAFGVYSKMASGVENLKKYEVVSMSDSQYVILSNCNDKALIVSFDVDENGQYIFYTSEYRFIDKYEGDFKYITMDSKPIIK